MSRVFRVALAQLSSSNNFQYNLDQCQKVMRLISHQGHRAHHAPVDAVFLPEACDWIGHSGDLAVKKRDSQLFLNELRQLAREFQVYVFSGLHYFPSTGDQANDGQEDDEKMFNSQIVIDRLGSIIERYDKVHLFDYGPAGLKESSSTRYGRHISPPVELRTCDNSSSLGARVGLAVCYDLRFSELSFALTNDSLEGRDQGANVLSYPSAFTLKTGRLDHWSVLLRARAIETQSFVIASAQIGRHRNSDESREPRLSWGQSMIVDPLGKIVVQLGNYDSPQYIITNEGVDVKILDNNIGTAVAICDLDINLVAKARSEMPMTQHRYDRKCQL